MHTCIKFQSAGLKCIGVNRRGQTGQGVTDLIVGNESGHTGNNLPNVNVGTGLQVLDAALGYDFTCVLVTGNKVKCFGRNDNGSLGNGNTTNLGTYSSDMGDNLPFVSLGTGVEAASIITGVYSKHACIIASKPVASAQRVKCWGYNNAYQLGYGDLTNRGDAPNQMGDALPFVNFGTESKVKTLALTIGSSCALLINDVLKCWGFASNGELGSGSANWVSTTGNLLPAIPIDSGKVIKTLSFGASHMCILYDDEVTLKCTGYNGNGQLGQGDTTIRGETPSTTFPSIPAIKLGTTMKIKVLQSGGEFNCVMFENFLIKCWGSNESGQLGIGSKTAVGTSANQMAYRLEYVKLFSPTASPTNRPTANPTTGAPTTAPTFSPTKKPTNPTTKAPTASPTKTPTRTPTILTPTKVPATATPTKSPITYSPTIRAPTTIAPNVGQTTSKPTASMGFTSARVKIATGFVVVVSLIILMVA